MTKETFRFKQFTVEQSATAGLKVGTDGVLLGAWCRLAPGQRRMLDAGTGTGVIALMLAQRAIGAHIDALDIDPACCRQAWRNAENSPWGGRITVIERSVQSHALRRRAGSPESAPVRGSLAAWGRSTPTYDHIVSNPPFFSESLLPPSASRATARHDTALPHPELAEAAAALLAEEGLFSLILPVEPGRAFIGHAAGCGLHLRRCDEVIPVAGAAPKRLLLEFGRTAGEPHYGSLTIADGEGRFTDAYKALTSDFYLKF